MKSVFILILFAFNNLSYGQKLSLNDLIKLSKSNADNFDTYVTAKGYKFWKSEPGDGYGEPTTIRKYAFKQNGIHHKAAYFICRISFASGVCQADYQMGYENEYVSIKNQLKVNGFKFLNSKDGADGTLYLTYKKGNVLVGLISAQSKNSLDESVTAYKAVVWELNE